MRKKYCLTLDLKEEDELLKAYDDLNEKVWPEIIHSVVL